MIKDYFEKEITREIETVIKADDRSHISDEVFEFVITDELKKHLSTLFSAYNSENGRGNGVWISGHFGNGKSHLLKILSYVLENREHDEWYCGEVFAEKIENDELLKADVLKAIQTPSESILFNIAHHAQTAEGDGSDRPIVSIFYKVFYEHLGYYGDSARIAEFEMWLDNNDLLQKFKEEFNSVIMDDRKMDWENDRMELFDPYVEEVIFKTLAKIRNGNVEQYENILDNIEKDYSQSIDRFAGLVNSYIESKPKGFKLNFFVDEVGQFVGDDIKMMLSIQTIAEALAERTRGKSWIMITSQADIQAVVDWEKAKEMDNFGRIQARFNVKIPLTTTGADEVVEKRLLTKKTDAQKMLEEHYKQKEAHLRTLLSFSEVGVQFKGYKNSQDFANKFPLVPYQFGLFQQSRIGLSSHNAFQGAHAAVGSRSMLGVFQQVIKSIAHKDQNALISFDKMYAGIRSELRGTIQANIEIAESNIENETAIRILKTLFMLKYYDQFKATKRNISVLLIDDQNIDLKNHEDEVEKALLILENQSYIQRNGEFYEYLTDKEKDIDTAIKNTEIDEQAITTFYKEIFFDEIIRDNKITYLDNKTAYEFSPIVNGVSYGRDKELKIEIITPDYIADEEQVRSHSMGTTILKLLLDPSPTFLRDVRLYKQTEKYVRQNQTATNDPEVLRILQSAGSGNTIRKENIILMANQYLANAVGFVNANRIESNGATDGKSKVIRAFQVLVRSTYSSLPMLRNIHFEEQMIREVATGNIPSLFNDEVNLSEPENEILTIITQRRSLNERTSLNDLKNILTVKPYGWTQNAIFTLLAKLNKTGGIDLIRNGSVIENNELVETLTNSSYYANTLVVPRTVYDASKVNKLKQIYRDAFDKTCGHNDAKDVGLAFKEGLKEMKIDVDNLLSKKSEYPFLENLYPLQDLLSDLIKKEYSYYIEEIDIFEDRLLDKKENLLSPILRFMNGEQKRIYDDIKLLIEKDVGNLNYMNADEVAHLRNFLSNDKPYTGGQIREAKEIMDRLKQEILQSIDDAKKETQDQIDFLMNNIENNDDFKKLKENGQSRVLNIYKEVSRILQDEKVISNIKQLKSDLKNKDVDALNLIQELLNKYSEEVGSVREDKVQYIRASNVAFNFDKSELKDVNDVNEYVEKLKEAYLEKVNKNIRIRL